MDMAATRVALTSALLCVAAGSVAQAQIQGMTVDPQSPCAGAAATFEVLGTGGCKVDITFGDGSPVVSFDTLPATTQHTYATAGTYDAGATSTTCAGKAAVEVEVRSCGIQAGHAPPDGPLRPLPPEHKAVAIPKIEGVLTFGIEPGAAVLVAGRLFGEQPGRVRLLGTAGEVDLTIDSWSPGAIGGSVPEDAASICPTGGIVVVSTDGVASNLWKAQVPLARKKLPAADVTLVACGDDANENSCNANVVEGDSCVSPYFPPWFIGLDREGRLLGPQGPSAVGYHANCWGAIGDDSGTDTYRIALKNGWVLDSAEFLSSVPDGEGSTQPPSGALPAGFVSGATTWEPSIEWSVTPADAVIYNLYVTITGPACSSHK